MIQIDVNLLLDSCRFMNKHRWFFVKAFYPGARFALLGMLLALCHRDIAAMLAAQKESSSNVD